MSRESSQPNPVNNLQDLAEELIYTPTAEDRALKARFMLMTLDNPLLDPSTISLATAERTLGRRLRNSEKPGFASWFLNKDENAQRLEYLFTLALSAAEEILCNTDPKAQSARVNMVKAISELAGKMPSRGSANSAGQTGQNLISSIGQMDKVALKAFLQKNGNTLTVTASRGEAEVLQPIDVTASDNPPIED